MKNKNPTFKILNFNLFDYIKPNDDTIDIAYSSKEVLNKQFFLNVIANTLSPFRFHYFTISKYKKIFNFYTKKQDWVKQFQTSLKINLIMINLLILLSISFSFIYFNQLNTYNSFQSKIDSKNNVNSNNELYKLLLSKTNIQEDLFKKIIKTKDEIKDNHKQSTEILKLINKILPKEIWLNKIDYINIDEKIKSKDKIKNNETYEITGNSLTDTSILLFMENLKNLETFKIIELEGIKSKIKEKQEIKEFKIKLTLGNKYE
jgi:hypothetical protein